MMRITLIRVAGFGKLKDIVLTPGAGITLIEGPNEAGKSTLLLFVRAMLYGLTKRDYERMRPWRNPEVYGGSMELDVGGVGYRIERDFAAGPGDLALYELGDEDARLLESPGERLGELLSGMSPTLFDHTLLVRQLGVETDKALADEILGLASTGSPVLSSLKSLEYLAGKKKELKSGIEPDAHRSYNITLGRIRAITGELGSEERANRIPEASAARDLASENVDRIVGLKTAKDEAIRSLEAELEGSDVDSAPGAERLRESTLALYAGYVKDRGRAPWLKALGIILILLALGALAIGMRYIEIPGLEAVSAFFEEEYRAYALSGTAALLGLILLIRGFVRGKRAANSEARLHALSRQHLRREETGPVTAEEINAWLGRMDEIAESAGRLDSLRAQREALAAELARSSDEYSARIRELDSELRTHETVEEKMRELKTLSREAEIERRSCEANEALSVEIEAVELAADTIRELSERIAASAGVYIHREAGRMIEGFSAGKYRDIYFGDGRDLRLMGPDGMVPVGELSQGTMDQTYLALRLAAGRLAAGGSDALPLIMDDSFAMYDEERLVSSLRFIAGEYKGQVIIFSCQGREGRILGEQGIEHSYMCL